jgi:AcrR family transcriptional regulator
VNLEARAATAELRRTRTRERLLDAAEAVILERGVDAVSIATIVESAGVSRGVFYNYFPTATDLLSELNRRVAEQVTGRLRALITRPVDPATRLAASLHTVMAAYTADPVRGWVAVQISMSRAPRAEAFEALFAMLYKEGVKAGQFRKVDMNAALTVCFGTIRMARSDAIGGAPPDQHIGVIALLLAAFGVPFDEAERISREEAALANAI